MKLGAVTTLAFGLAAQLLNNAAYSTNGKIETTGEGVQVNTSNSLRAGPRGYNLLEDTSGRKKLIHFDRERVPERVVHALGSGAYGQFESYGDWSNITSACWLQQGARSEAFTRFSVVVASAGGSEVNRDTHGFATKIYSECGNQDLVGNHVPSFFINDGIDFPDLIHSVKQEANKGFPTDGTAHPTAYDFFNLHPEGSFQLMTVLSDLGIPRDERHIRGNGVHTYRFINAAGKSTFFKWYWMPTLGLRSLVYDEATTLAGKQANWQRIDLFDSIEAGNYPEWELAIQMFPDDDTFMYKGYDLLIPTQVIPFDVAPLVKLGKLTLNRNFRNFFAEPEAISFAPSNVVDGVSWVPDPVLQWRLMSYDDTASHRHGSPNSYLLPINRAIAPVNNNYRDGYMQPLIFQGDQTSTPNNLGGVSSASANETLPYTSPGETAGQGPIGRYAPSYDSFYQTRMFWYGLGQYAQQHTVDAYRFELANVGDATVVQRYIDETLNNIDNCLARRVAYGIGATMPPVGTGAVSNNATYPNSYASSFYTLDTNVTKSNVGLQVAVIANDTLLTGGDVAAMISLLSAQKVSLTVVAPKIGTLASGVNATASFLISSSVFYDAIFIGSSGNASSTNSASLTADMASFVEQAYSHGKPIGALGSSGPAFLAGLGISNQPGVFIEEVGEVLAVGHVQILLRFA
ncbi:hypothetical protein M409DRAFT_70374 [Zasmidium cellare ATCC 36951]|uniref:Catalase n=1 Tax=Zasmidium cellare ATCC 36951 TaxID=1080233 RepID=A0A6A6C373_ZASCE|nr:uncharacterized protein M409DRAFT_70374 [Zasmidium cellare ATCC 36951]KAF2160640.1 hypothetical protein M409DRAFT_70374 [Zasmidium cellare ATCC 36951]